MLLNPAIINMRDRHVSTIEYEVLALNLKDIGGIMDSKKLTNNYGYTLIELIMAATIITIISAVAVPNYTRYLASTRENVCIINRQTILYTYYLHTIKEPEITLSEYIRIYYSEESCSVCPSGGTLTASGLGEEAELNCSLHKDTAIESGPEAIDMEIPESLLNPG
jgi:prepilin-type N-terminal cleavage/methylation domain-containing protein